MKNALILLAGGSGKRMRNEVPKQFLEIGNQNLIEYFLTNLDSKIFEIIVISTKKNYKEKYLKLLKKKFINYNIQYVESGKTRQHSVYNSLKYLKKNNPNNVLIHDSARPLASNSLIKRIINCLNKKICCTPFVYSNDLMRSKEKFDIKKNKIMNIQTPQGFIYKKILKAHEINKKINARDDSSLLKSIDENYKLIKGENANFKITSKNDLELFNRIRKREYRSGIGYDIHKINFSSKKKLILCGIKINHPPLIGHSDADVGFHAICDSILGSLSMRDIGFHFNDNDKKWKNANSKIFLKYCSKKLFEKGYKIVNLDINFICETPKISKLVILMKKNLSILLKISKKNISIKATTNEKIGFIGNGEGIAAESIVQIVNV